MTSKYATCCQQCPDTGARCQDKDPSHSGPCDFPIAGPCLCPAGHWIGFASPRADEALCDVCGVTVKRGDPQPTTGAANGQV